MVFLKFVKQASVNTTSPVFNVSGGFFLTNLNSQTKQLLQ